MKIRVKDAKEKESMFACGVLVLPVPEGVEVKKLYPEIDRALAGAPSKFRGEFTGRQAEVLLLHTLGKIKPERVLFLGIGKKEVIDTEKIRQAGGKAAGFMKGAGDAALATRVFHSGFGAKKLSAGEAVRAFLEGVMLSLYEFSVYKNKDKNKKEPPGVFTVFSPLGLGREVKEAETLAGAASFARDLVNTPANDMKPCTLAQAARSLKGVRVKVIEKGEAERMGMGAYLSVSRGSAEPPKFIIASYRKSEKPPVVLIGKSITFDSGGISIKPSEGMEKMKYDMAGGAAVLGVLKAVSEMRLPLHVVGILPAAENLPGGRASKPGDIVRTLDGHTVEIINTDAEGRLVMADALAYAAGMKPKPGAVIDIATLTGACSIALGNEAAALMGNDDKLLSEIEGASAQTGERVWRMPLYEEYGEYLKSDAADLKNVGGRSGGLVTAGYFLKEFARDLRWAHLDIASTAWTDKAKPYIPVGATGMGVRLLVNFLRMNF
jgi:leucyl aminopeptidase